MTKSDIIETIDIVTDPENMSPVKALEFLEQIATEIGTRIDGIKDDLRNAELEHDAS